EIINRGGENVSPREVDEVLLEHPSVAQAVTFSVPDSRLGEQVAAAVVPNAEPGHRNGNSAAEERDLRHFVAERLAPYKVPRRIILLDEIPVGPSGKLRRIGLADELGLAELDRTEDTSCFEPPSTAAQHLLAELWSEVLDRNGFGVRDHFLDVGGDSLAATQLLTRLRDEVEVEISMLDFFDSPTIAQQSELLEDLLLEGAERSRKEPTR
ncbi:MAG: AMP-binding enzyme, partial [Acidimicrobiales bacterium]